MILRRLALPGNLRPNALGPALVLPAAKALHSLGGSTARESLAEPKYAAALSPGPSDEWEAALYLQFEAGESVTRHAACAIKAL